MLQYYPSSVFNFVSCLLIDDVLPAVDVDLGAVAEHGEGEGETFPEEPEPEPVPDGQQPPRQQQYAEALREHAKAIREAINAGRE